MIVSFSDFDVKFGSFDTDVQFDYVMHLTFSLDLPGSKEYLYDEIRMTTSSNLKTDNDIMFWDLKTHKLDLSHQSHRQLPLRNQLKITKNEYS